MKNQINIKLSLPDVEDVILEVPQELSEDYIIKSLSDFGNWEPSLTQKVSLIFKKAKLQKKNYKFVDIGACFGYYSIIASQHGIPSIAFEPNPTTAAVIKNHISSKDASITLREYALGSENGSVTLTSPEGNIGATQILQAENVKAVVPIHKLDDEKIKEDIILIKIDVEGKEGDVIAGGINMLKNTQPEFLLIETSPIYTPVETIINKVFIPLWELNYISFDLGVQEKGSMEEIITVFKFIDTVEELNRFFKDKAQTNILFIKKDSAKVKMLTGTQWKDELIIQWSQEYSNNLNDKLYLSNVYLRDLTEKLEQSKQPQENSYLYTPNSEIIKEFQNKFEQGSNLILERFKASEDLLVGKFVDFVQNEITVVNHVIIEKIANAENKIQASNTDQHNQLKEIFSNNKLSLDILGDVQKKLEEVFTIGQNIQLKTEEKDKQIQTLLNTSQVLESILKLLQHNTEQIVTMHQKQDAEIQEKNKQLQQLGNNKDFFENIYKLLEQNKNTLQMVEEKFTSDLSEKNKQINLLIDRNITQENNYRLELENKTAEIKHLFGENSKLQTDRDYFKDQGVFEVLKRKFSKRAEK